MSMSNYEKGKFLSKGAFGSAFLAKCKRTQKDYVVKMVEIEKLSRKERDAARKECGILGSLKHPNIIEYRESFEDGGHLCIVMAFAEGGDMTGVLKAQRGKLLEEDTIMDWFVQICLGMKHVHDRKILHRDLKSQNIFLSNKKRIIKLGDFGIAKVLKHTMEVAKTAIGTPYYLSPEICEGKSYNNKSDIWSLGIVLYELCTLRCPFDASNLNGLVLKIIRGVYSPVPAHFTPQLKGLVGLLLSKDPRARPNINQILSMPIMTARMGKFLDTELRREEFSHTVLHGIPTKLDANPRDRLEAAAAARAPASMQRESSDKARNATSRPSTDPSRGSSVASSNRTPAQPAAAASVRPERSERESNWDKMVGGAGAPAAGKPSGAKAVDARAQAEEEERRKARKEEERAAERARQERMARGANLAAQRAGAEVTGANSRQQAAAAADANYLKLKQKEAEEAKEKDKERKREEERKELQRLRDARRKEFIEKQREAERARRAAAQQHEAVGAQEGGGGGGLAQPTGIHIYTKAGAVQSRDAMLQAEERRRIWQEQQEAAERNKRRIEGEKGPSGGGGRDTPSGEGKREEVKAQREKEKEQQRQKEEEELKRIRQEHFEQRKAAAERAQQENHPSERKEPKEEGAKKAGGKAEATMGVAVYSGDMDEAAQAGGAEGGGPDEEEDDYGAMLKNMTALLSHDAEDDKIAPVEVARQKKREEPERKGGGEGGGGGADGKKGAEGKVDEEYDNDSFEEEENVDSESVHHRIEELRMQLETDMGFDRFLSAYQYMKAIQENDDNELVTEKIVQLMGEENQHLFPQLVQLISCEQTAYGN